MLFGLGLLSAIYLWLQSFSTAPVQYSMGGDYTHTSSNFELIFSIIKICLAFVPFLLSLIVLIVVCLAVVDKIWSKPVKLKFLAGTSKFWSWAMVGLWLVSLVEFSLTNYFILDHMPHVPDSIAYTHQAKLFAAGKFYLELGNLAEHFPLVGLINYQGKLFSQYTFGHPLMLSLGYTWGQPWLIPPLVGSLGLVLIYLVGKEIYSKRIGFVAALLAFTSPFVKMNSVSFMSHNSALVFTLISLLFFIKFIKSQKLIYSLFLGLSLGFLINIRPFTAFLVAVPLGLFSIFFLTNHRQKFWQTIIKFLPFLVGLGVMLGCYYGYNWILTGNPTISGYDLGFVAQFGINQTRTWAMAWSDTYSNFILLSRVLMGWPFSLGFLFVLVFGLTAKKKSWDWLLLGLIFSLMGGYFFYKGSWMMYGPRFWYETTPFWIFLIVLGIEKFPELIKKLVPDLMKLNLKFKSQAIILINYYVVALLVVYSLTNWYQQKESIRWQADFTPQNLGELKNFNYADHKLITAIENQKIHSALVFIKPGVNWWEYGVPSYFMDLTFQEDIIYAIDLGDERNLNLINLYPNRKLFRADYDVAKIAPY